MEKMRISGKIATEVALQARKRRPIKLLGADGALPSAQPSTEHDQGNRAPPRVRKPSPSNDQCVAPSPDLESHRQCLRQAFGNTLSDEFVEVMLGKLEAANVPVAIQKVDEKSYGVGVDGLLGMSFLSRFEVQMANGSIEVRTRRPKK